MLDRRALRCAAIVVFAASCCAWTTRDTDSSTSSRRAYLAVENETECPVCIYVNGRFAVRCEPFSRETIQCRIFGDVELVGRSRCDTWGPETVELIPNETTTWRIGRCNHRCRRRSASPMAWFDLL